MAIDPKRAWRVSAPSPPGARAGLEPDALVVVRESLDELRDAFKAAQGRVVPPVRARSSTN